MGEQIVQMPDIILFWAGSSTYNIITEWKVLKCVVDMVDRKQTT